MKLEFPEEFKQRISKLTDFKEYEKTTYSDNIILQSKAYYNMGNCLYRLNKLPEAIQFYKKALELWKQPQDYMAVSP